MPSCPLNKECSSPLSCQCRAPPPGASPAHRTCQSRHTVLYYTQGNNKWAIGHHTRGWYTIWIIRDRASSYGLVYYKHICPNTWVSSMKNRPSTGKVKYWSATFLSRTNMSSKYRHVGCLSRGNGLQCWSVVLRY